MPTGLGRRYQSDCRALLRGTIPEWPYATDVAGILQLNTDPIGIGEIQLLRVASGADVRIHALRFKIATRPVRY